MRKSLRALLISAGLIGVAGSYGIVYNCIEKTGQLFKEFPAAKRYFQVKQERDFINQEIDTLLTGRNNSTHKSKIQHLLDLQNKYSNLENEYWKLKKQPEVAEYQRISKSNFDRCFKEEVALGSLSVILFGVGTLTKSKNS